LILLPLPGRLLQPGAHRRVHIVLQLTELVTNRSFSIVGHHASSSHHIEHHCCLVAAPIGVVAGAPDMPLPAHVRSLVPASF